MSAISDFKDTLHNVVVRFARATLPSAKKPYTLRTAHQDELDIRAVAGMAEIYNVYVSPKVIEEGLTAGLALIRYLVSDGYKVKTPLFTVRVAVPGEYEGDETHLPEGVRPEPRILPSEAFCDYVAKRVKVEIEGERDQGAIIASAVDEATGLVKQSATIGEFLTIQGLGLKIKADDAHREQAGLYFEDPSGARFRVKTLAVNEPHTLKTLVPETLTPGQSYKLVVVTQNSARGHGTLLNEVRTIHSMFTLIAQH